jgi:hypothetical protein
MSDILKTATPSDAEISAAVDVLSRLEAGRLPYPLFMQMARLATLATVELVPLRGSTEKDVEVLLLPRPRGDLWEGQWHVPGTVILPTDALAHPHDFDAPLSRLIGETGELRSGVRAVAKPVHIDAERRKTLRGDEFAAIHYVEVEGEPTEGMFYPVRDFPEKIPAPGVIDHHVGFVEQAVARYLNDKKESL